MTRGAAWPITAPIRVLMKLTDVGWKLGGAALPELPADSDEVAGGAIVAECVSAVAPPLASSVLRGLGAVRCGDAPAATA